MQVFALGGRTKEDEAADVGYYGLRITLGLHFERDIHFQDVGKGHFIVRRLERKYGVDPIKHE